MENKELSKSKTIVLASDDENMIQVYELFDDESELLEAKETYKKYRKNYEKAVMMDWDDFMARINFELIF